MEKRRESERGEKEEERASARNLVVRKVVMSGVQHRPSLTFRSGITRRCWSIAGPIT